MMIKYLSLGLAALAGAAMAVQGTLNAALGKVLGIWESTLIVHLIGTATVLAIILVGGIGFSNLGKLSGTLVCLSGRSAQCNHNIRGGTGYSRGWSRQCHHRNYCRPDNHCPGD